jgi:hypothetical protein
VDEIAIVPKLTQDETVEAGESGRNAIKAVEVEPSGGVDNDEHSNSSSNNDSDGEEATHDETAEPTSDGEWNTTTRLGRTSRLPSRYRTEIGAAAIMKNMTKIERNYYQMLLDENEDCDEEDHEIACVGAGLGGGFKSTKELHAMKYKQVMKTPGKDNWTDALFEEHERMVKRKVWSAELRKNVPKDAKVLTSTWAMKKKANGRFRARLNARGYEQVDGEHFDSTNISSPVTNDATIRIIMVLAIIFRWSAGLVDVQ